MNKVAAEKLTIQQRFERFHEANPNVFDMIVREAHRAKEKGKTRFGIRAIIEVIRWETFLKTTDTDMFAKNSYKLNDHYISR